MSEGYRLWIVRAPYDVDLGEGADYQGDDDDGDPGRSFVRTYVKATDAEAAALRVIPSVMSVEMAKDKSYPDWSFGNGTELNVSDGARRWEHGDSL